MIANGLVRGALPALGQPKTPATIPHSHRRGKEFRDRSVRAGAGRDAKIDWKALSKRIGHADVAFPMKQYVQTDLEAGRQLANTLAELIIGGTLASTVISDETHEDQGATADGDPGEAA
jgi:hypothetical protein